MMAGRTTTASLGRQGVPAFIGQKAEAKPARTTLLEPRISVQARVRYLCDTKVEAECLWFG